MTVFTIVSQGDDPSSFAQWEAAPEFEKGRRHPVTNRAGYQYYTATHTDAADASFAVMYQGAAQSVVKCNVLGNILGYFSGPMTLWFRDGLDGQACRHVIHAAQRQLVDIAAKTQADAIVVKEEKPNEGQTNLAREFEARGIKADVRQTGLCNLSLTEKEIHGRIRKSFKSLVNWGRQNLTMKYFSANNPDMELYESYRRFHAEVAGRVTRNDASWQAMRNWLLTSTGELALAYLETGDLVAGTMTIDGTETSLYASGVYDRNRFDMPLSHFVVYDAIIRSKNRGLKWFDLGHLPEKGSVTDKEYNIGFFKRGFATDIGIDNVWKFKPAENLW